MKERANAPLLFGKVGGELRRLRQAAGVNQASVAKTLGCSQDTVSNFERGHRWPSDEQIEKWCRFVNASSADLKNILALASSGRFSDRRWWDMFSGVFPAADNKFFAYEDAATEIRSYSADYVPALFQTRAYVEACADYYRADDSAADRARWVQVRMERKAVVDRGEAEINAIFSEGALHTKIGGDEAQLTQLRYLIEVAELPKVRLRVIPYDAGVANLSAPPFQILTLPGDTAPMLVREMSRSLDLSQEPPLIEAHRRKMEQYASSALAPEETIKMIKRVVGRHA
jgi:transcriptional regulator with XRE-family HTH domain